MSQKINSKEEEIVSELSDIEFDEDDALTLLDDEELQSSSADMEDEDLSTFYLDYPEETKDLTGTVDLYTEEVVEDEFKLEENEAQEPIKEHQLLETLEKESYPVEEPEIIDKPNTNIDAYLSGNLEIKPKEELRIEKKDTVVTSVVKPIEPRYITPVSTEVIPRTSSIDLSDLNQLFAKVEDNVKGASDIVNRNAEIKRKIDERYDELQKLQMDHEKNKQSDYAEINSYKDEVYNKLKTKKLEIEEELTALRTEQANFSTEKALYDKESQSLNGERETFEKEKAAALENIAVKERELHDTYEDRVKNIEQVENGLIRRKEQLDIEKAALIKEREQCEIEKKELAENLVKFNQLVDNFTKGVDRFNETN
jgi:Uncharacterized protein conserved in bacteria with the myosin-like domain